MYTSNSPRYTEGYGESQVGEDSEGEEAMYESSNFFIGLGSQMMERGGRNRRIFDQITDIEVDDIFNDIELDFGIMDGDEFEVYVDYSGGEEEQEDQQRGADLRKIKEIKAKKLREGTQCSVCLMKLKRGDKLVKLDCKHYFHKGCIIPWLENHNNCPNCRRSVT